MVNFDRLEALIRQQGKKKSHLCALAGKGRGYIADAKNGNGTISDEALLVFAAELGTTTAYLKGETDDAGIKNPPALTEKERRDVAREAERMMENLSEAGDLMFDGVPMSQEARDSMLAAMKLGLEAARLKNKETYTPKKYKK